jgi:hypothetical protein
MHTIRICEVGDRAAPITLVVFPPRHWWADLATIFHDLQQHSQQWVKGVREHHKEGLPIVCRVIVRIGRVSTIVTPVHTFAVREDFGPHTVFVERLSRAIALVVVVPEEIYMPVSKEGEAALRNRYRDFGMSHRCWGQVCIVDRWRSPRGRERDGSGEECAKCKQLRKDHVG